MFVFFFFFRCAYSLAVGSANALTDTFDWRVVWWLFGGCGVVWSALLFAALPKAINSSKQQSKLAKKSKNNNNTKYDTNRSEAEVSETERRYGIEFLTEIRQNGRL